MGKSTDLPSQIIRRYSICFYPNRYLLWAFYYSRGFLLLRKEQPHLLAFSLSLSSRSLSLALFCSLACRCVPQWKSLGCRSSFLTPHLLVENAFFCCVRFLLLAAAIVFFCMQKKSFVIQKSSAQNLMTKKFMLWICKVKLLSLVINSRNSVVYF